MTIATRIAPQIAAPYAYTDTAPVCDHTSEISDYWNEVMDPENEIGAYVEALYETDKESGDYPSGYGFGGLQYTDFTEYTAKMIGLTVETKDYVHFVDRAEVARLFGADWIKQIEASTEEYLEENA